MRKIIYTFAILTITMITGGAHAKAPDYPLPESQSYYENYQEAPQAHPSSLNVHNDLNETVETLIIHFLNNNFIPTPQDCITNPLDNLPIGSEETCFYFYPEDRSGNILLSYRYQGKLYQRVVPSISESTVINLSDFIEQPIDDYPIENDNIDIDYNEAYCHQLGQTIQNMLRQQR